MQFKAHNITLTCWILIVMVSLTKSQQIIPEINTTLFYQFNTPGRWYLSAFSSPYDDMTVNTVSFIQSQTLEGQPAGISFMSFIMNCFTYIAPQIPVGIYDMGVYYRSQYKKVLDSTETPLQFRIQDEGKNVIAEHKFPYGDGSFYRTSGTISSQFLIQQPIKNAKILFCKQRKGFESDGIIFMGKFSLLYKRPLTGVPNCIQTIFLNGGMYCNACNPGYVIDSTKSCAPKVEYCSIYKNRVCTVCIYGFFLRDNTCIQQSPECQQTDSKGLCTQCQSGFSVKQGLCVKDPVIVNCAPSQYKSTQGVCVEGNIKDCVKYVSPSGQCETCISGYTVNSQGQCVFTCPPQTETQKFILLNGVCVGTDINCDESNQDGSCGVCKDGFYVSKGRCIRQNNANNFLTIENTGNDQLREDESNNFYILRSDESRYYLTGTWKNLQVWADNSNSLYIKVSNGRRQYLTGQYERLYAYQDTNGNWYIINTNGKRIYLSSNNNNNLRG